MRILITGGAGYIGNILVHKLFQAKSRHKSQFKFNDYQHYINFDKLTVYDNLMYKQDSLINYCYRDDFEFIHGDVRDSKFIDIVKDYDVIIPLAAIVGFPACKKDPELAKQINEDQIKKICDNSKAKIIFPNTNSGYGITDGSSEVTEENELSPISVYGTTKINAEKYVIENNGISLRLATVFGVSPRMRLDLLVNDFVYKAFNDGYIVLFEKDFKRNYIHIQDVAMAFIFMINNFQQHSGNVFNLGLSNANLSKHELCLKIKEFLPKFSIQFDEINEDPDKRNYIVSNKKIENIGWKSYYSLDSGIKELIKAYRILSVNNKKYTNL